MADSIKADLTKFTAYQLERYLAMRGVDQCKFQEILASTQTATGKDSKRVHRATPAAVIKLLEKHKFGGLANTVHIVHTDLLLDEKLMASACELAPNVLIIPKSSEPAVY